MALRTGLAHLPLSAAIAPVVTLVLFAACSSGSEPTATPSPGQTHTGSPVPSPSSGLQGRALAGPQCPVERAGSPCPDKPVRASIEVWSAGRARKVTTFSTAADGTFHIALPPADYFLLPLPPSPGSPFPRGTPQTVTVAPGQWTAVTLHYDTGIR